MKVSHVSAIVLACTLAACSSTKTVNPDEPIRNQKLTTSFTEDNIKVETNCAWYKPWQSECQIVAIEATASAWTNGASTVQVNEGRKVARSEAYANVAHFLRNQVTSTRVTNVLAKHMEKAQDNFSANGAESEMSDKEAKNTSKTVRDNTNDTVRTVTRTVRENSEVMLRGFKVIKEEKVGQQEVSVTIRWDNDSDRAARYLLKRMGN